MGKGGSEVFSVSTAIFLKRELLKSKFSHKKNWVKTQDGFTVLELVSVLVLLGILSSMAVPKYIALQDQSSDQTIKKAVNQLNAQVREIFKKNKLVDESTGPYQGYKGDLGPEVIVTGQAPDTPGSGTIRLIKNSDTYAIVWNPGVQKDTKAPGHFKLGDKI